MDLSVEAETGHLLWVVCNAWTEHPAKHLELQACEAAIRPPLVVSCMSRAQKEGWCPSKISCACRYVSSAIFWFFGPGAEGLPDRQFNMAMISCCSTDC